jgi:hypothetical protein
MEGRRSRFSIIGPLSLVFSYATLSLARNGARVEA